MDTFRWYGFYKKFFLLTLIYATFSFVGNNNILFLNSNFDMQKDLHMCTLQSIKLSKKQFKLLKEIIPELESLINLLFMDCLLYIRDS